jgi:hypothetical protein
VPTLAGAVVAAVLVAVAIGLRPAGTAIPAPPATGGSATPSVTPDPTPSDAAPPPSQSAAEARMWDIYPEVAALSLAERTTRAKGDPEPVVTAEGVWQLAHPDISAILSEDDGCAPRYGRPRYRLCSSGYSEIQLLAPDRSRLLRVYAFPEIPVQWFQVTRDAVYCGRTGDGAVPESMLCRIERGGPLTMKGRFYGCDGPDCGPLDSSEVSTWPGTWTQGTEPIDGGFDGVELRGHDLAVVDATGRVTVKLDPRTLRER